MISPDSIHATLIFSFSLKNDQQSIVKPIFFTIFYDSSQQATPPPFLFLVSIIHLVSCLFSFYLMSPPNHCVESIRRSFPYWSTFLLIHLSFYSVCFWYSSKAHHKFSEHLQSDPCLRSSLKASRASGWPGCWFMTLSRSLSFTQHVSLWLLPV